MMVFPNNKVLELDGLIVFFLFFWANILGIKEMVALAQR